MLNPDFPKTLAGWLSHLEALHPQKIELGLERVSAVAGFLFTGIPPVLTVAGTNGKGSTCAMLEAMLLAAGYRVGLYTSPHLSRYNERVRIDGRDVDDAVLCTAFAAVERARGDVWLTYFEFGTLTAMQAFIDAEIEIAILEVGLGGRLDAVNLFDPLGAIVTQIGIDHTEYLGSTREAIGFEKAGVFRPGLPAVCSDPSPPQTLINHIADLGADQWQLGRDFFYEADAAEWRYRSRSGAAISLPLPLLRGEHQLRNAAGAIALLDALSASLPVSRQDMRTGLLSARPRGRFQAIRQRPSVIVDVAHNRDSALALAENLAALPPARTFAVFGMLNDKDIAGVIEAVKAYVDHWHVAGLPGPRGATADMLCGLLTQSGITDVSVAPRIQDAYTAACVSAAENDRIIVFGSFLTVAAVLESLRE